MVKKVRRTLPDLLNCFDVVHEVVPKIENSMNIDHQTLRALCLAWQWNKGAIKPGIVYNLGKLQKP